MKKITLGKIRKPTPGERQRAIDADNIRTTEQTNEHLEIVWSWKRNGLFELAQKAELDQLTAACEKAEHAIYQCEIIERAYHEHKRSQTDLSTNDWCKIINAIRYAEYDPTGHETVPDWKWFVDTILGLAQCQREASEDAALKIHNAIYKRIREDEINKATIEKLHGLSQRLMDIQADTTAAAMNTATINNGVAWLVADRQRKNKDNKERGKINQATGNTEESERAAQDMQTALNRVHDRMKHGAKYVIGECRKVCKEFEPLTTKKNELGKFESCAPLTGMDGKPIKPDTLAKNYRERFGTKKAKKGKTARTAKPKRRTK